MSVFKDGVGSKRLIAMVGALFCMGMLAYRAVAMKDALTVAEIMAWLGGIAADLAVLGAATVAEKKYVGVAP